MKRSYIVLCALVGLLPLLIGGDHEGVAAQVCRANGIVMERRPPLGKCNTENNSECWKQGKLYPVYRCSARVTANTKAFLTLNSFEKGGDGGGLSECDNQYHSVSIPVVALSTGWFNNQHRCFDNITIHRNGQSVVAMVVDECDSTAGCNDEHDYQPPCLNNIVDASKALWKALGVRRSDWGGLDITWSDA